MAAQTTQHVLDWTPVVTTIVGVAATLAGVWFGWWLSGRRSVDDRAKRLANHWAALGAELDLCKRYAGAYLVLTDNEKKGASPAYRLPLSAYRESYPSLLSDGALEQEQEVLSIVEFFVKAEEINRSLDSSEEIRLSEHPPRVSATLMLEMEERRIDPKVQKLIELYPAAAAVVARHRKLGR